MDMVGEAEILEEAIRNKKNNRKERFLRCGVCLML